MTEKEKMLRGMLYDADDSTLCADRVRAKELCHAYNQLRPSDAAGMRELLQRLLGETGETFCVTAPFWCDYGYNIRLGEHFYANHNLVILDCAAVTFGEHVFVAQHHRYELCLLGGAYSDILRYSKRDGPRKDEGYRYDRIPKERRIGPPAWDNIKKAA